MNIFKNFKTKKQLKEENERLMCMLHTTVPEPLHIMERNVNKVQSSVEITYAMRDMPESMIKRELAVRMAEYLEPLIEYNFHDSEKGGKIYTGSLYVAEKR